MDKQNVTLSLPQRILRKAKKIAIDQDRSLSGLMVELLTYLIAARCPKNLGSAAIKLAEREDQYASARREYLALLALDTDLGAKGSISWTRADLHDR